MKSAVIIRSLNPLNGVHFEQELLLSRRYQQPRHIGLDPLQSIEHGHQSIREHVNDILRHKAKQTD
jgi:hypothetical protein